MDSQCPSCGGFCKKSGCERADYVPPEQEPVGWMVYTLDGASVCVTDNPADFTPEHRALPLYTTPPQRTLVLLTTQEVAAIAERVYGSTHHDDITFGMELQIKLKEKNT